MAALTLSAQQRQTEAQVKQKLIGSFKLVSYTNYDQNGVASQAAYITGQISYDASNRMPPADPCSWARRLSRNRNV